MAVNDDAEFHPLPLAMGQLGDLGFGCVRQPDRFQRLVSNPVRFGACVSLAGRKPEVFSCVPSSNLSRLASAFKSVSCTRSSASWRLL